MLRDNWKVLTRRRTDHFSTKKLENTENTCCCFLFTVSNSGLPLADHAFVPRVVVMCMHSRKRLPLFPTCDREF